MEWPTDHLLLCFLTLATVVLCIFAVQRLRAVQGQTLLALKRPTSVAVILMSCAFASVGVSGYGYSTGKTWLLIYGAVSAAIFFASDLVVALTARDDK